VGEGGTDAPTGRRDAPPDDKLRAFVAGEGSVSADADPSSGADFVHATFSHKGRRKKAPAYDA
jgi:hypothetical protein